LPASRIEGSGKRSLRRSKLSTRKFSAWKKKKICHIVIWTRKAKIFWAKNMHMCMHTYMHTNICKWHRSRTHIPIFSSKNSKTITDYVSTGADDEV
jgi:hypothetical protein